MGLDRVGRVVAERQSQGRLLGGEGGEDGRRGLVGVALLLPVRVGQARPWGVSATDAGREIIAEALLTVRQSERVSAAAEWHRRGETGVLRVGFEASGAGELTRVRGFARVVRELAAAGSGGRT